METITNPVGLPHFKDHLDAPGLAAWVNAKGGKVMPKAAGNDYEVIRWYLGDEPVSIIYCTKRGKLTYYGGAKDQYLAFLQESGK